MVLMRVRRKNFLPTFVLILILWSVFTAMIILVDPQILKDVLLPGSYFPFFAIFFPASFLTLALLLANSLRGLLVATGITVFLLLRIFQLGNLLNLMLIIGLVVALDRFFQH
jgi:hypothetical protein